MGTFRVQIQYFLWKHISIGLYGVHDIAFQSVKFQFTTAVNIVQIHWILVIGQPNCTEPRHNCTRVYHRSKLDFSTFALS